MENLCRLNHPAISDASDGSPARCARLRRPAVAHATLVALRGGRGGFFCVGSTGAPLPVVTESCTRMTIPRGLIAGTAAAMALVWAVRDRPGAETRVLSRANCALCRPARSHRPKPAGQDPSRPHSPALGRVPVGNGRKVTRSGSSPNTASAPDTCATSSTTRGSGCGYGSACATAGYPASPPSCPMTTPWHANDASSAGTRSRLQRNQRACAGCRPAHRARATHARRVTRSDRHQHRTGAEDADRRPDPRARRRAPRPVAEPLA